MPKLRPETAKARAQSLIKPLLRNRLNQAATARELGVSTATLSEQVKKPLVQKTLAEYLNKKFNQKYIQKKFAEGLEAKKVVGYLNNKTAGVDKVSDEFVEVDDYHCRHKYLVTLLQCGGHLKISDGGNNINAVNIQVNISSGDGFLSPAEQAKQNAAGK